MNKHESTKAHLASSKSNATKSPQTPKNVPRTIHKEELPVSMPDPSLQQRRNPAGELGLLRIEMALDQIHLRIP
ncbi:uncharacterized protein L3040_005128 [Drepanopeziza brunnea f. sp. 'multigermtubi']|uniref:uncharacterized protein n=1 Tax=Drepanopeziza brunnea f. sp. 'multigermtubi' TaxID=698441 RepID=UPI0023990D20|nr:hypothetical protein L3040_005128 [Drepanopeziza brunnea f. sp. 'multigermtubi']